MLKYLFFGLFLSFSNLSASSQALEEEVDEAQKGQILPSGLIQIPNFFNPILAGLKLVDAAFRYACCGSQGPAAEDFSFLPFSECVEVLEGMLGATHIRLHGPEYWQGNLAVARYQLSVNPNSKMKYCFTYLINDGKSCLYIAFDQPQPIEEFDYREGEINRFTFYVGKNIRRTIYYKSGKRKNMLKVTIVIQNAWIESRKSKYIYDDSHPPRTTNSHYYNFFLLQY